MDGGGFIGGFVEGGGFGFGAREIGGGLWRVCHSVDKWVREIEFGFGDERARFGDGVVGVWRWWRWR